MGFNIEEVLNDMAEAAITLAGGEAGDIKERVLSILENEKESLEELGMAKIAGEITEEVFEREIEREKKIVEIELLTVKIMTKAAVQKAVNAAVEVFQKVVKAAI